jgi:hypothetical protein
MKRRTYLCLIGLYFVSAQANAAFLVEAHSSGKAMIRRRRTPGPQRTLCAPESTAFLFYRRPAKEKIR